jgi:hypothetical protein
MIHVRIHSKEALENSLDDIRKIFGERDSYFGRENGFIVQQRLNPLNQLIDILRSRQPLGFLDASKKQIKASSYCFFSFPPSFVKRPLFSRPPNGIHIEDLQT